MLSLVKYGTGKGETELRDMPIPEIEDNDLLIEVRAAGICGSDIAYDNGEHPHHLNCPVILGHEFSGVVSKVGKNVRDWKLGDRVVSDNTGYVCGKCYACSTGQFLSCPDRLGLGYGTHGGFTDYVKISGELLMRNPNTLFHIPDSISFEEAAILDPVCNAYKGIVQESHILPGEDIAIFGIGPIGLFAVQIANLIGCANIIVIASSANEERFLMAKRYGANHIIRYDKENVIARIKDITNKEMVAAAIDCAGPNSVISQAMDSLRNGGEIIKIGYDKNPYNYSLDNLLERGITLKGHFGYDFVSWKNCLKLLELGKIDLKGMISHHIRLEDWKTGFDLVRNRKAIKIIFTKDESLLKNKLNL